MNILDFIDSADVREYNKNTQLLPMEQAVIIYKSETTTVEEKLAAWQELLDTYSEEEFQHLKNIPMIKSGKTNKQILTDTVQAELCTDEELPKEQKILLLLRNVYVGKLSIELLLRLYSRYGKFAYEALHKKVDKVDIDFSVPFMDERFMERKENPPTSRAYINIVDMIKEVLDE